MARMRSGRREAYRWRSFGSESTTTSPMLQQAICGERVYFVQMGKGGPIKIGTTTNLTTRLAALQDGAPEDLILLGSIPGSYREEAEFHEILATHRKRGEWFEPSVEVVQVIGTALHWW